VLEASNSGNFFINAISPVTGGQGIREAINRSLLGFIPYHDSPYFMHAIIGAGAVILVWCMFWWWYNFIR